MQTLVTVLSGIALLVWGTHIVRSGVLRVFGGGLRRVLGGSMANPFTAFLAGLGVTGLVQSSSATALLAGSFVGQNLMGLAPALAIMLGADVGTSLVVQLFSLDLSWLSPLLIGVGVLFHLTRKATRAGQMGRIAIGLGLIILALQIILQTVRPVTGAAGVKVIFGTLTGDPLLDILIGAVFTLMAWSSLAVVLLTAAFVSSGVISLKVGLFLVIGANLGSGIVAMIATLGGGNASRRVALGNLLFKLIGCVVTVALLAYIEYVLALIDPDPQRLVVNFHTAFNLLVALTLIGFIRPVARLAERLLPEDPQKESKIAARHLDPAALETPALATSNAAREVLRIGDIIENMLAGLLTVIRTNDLQLARQIRRMDDDVDGLYTSIKLYLTQIGREALEDRDARRWADIISITINLEHVGDIIERIVDDLIDKKIAHRLEFSEAGMAEICDMHARVVANLRLGMNVFLNGDLKSAQRLLATKVELRQLQQQYADSHLGRLAGQTVQSIETSSLHLDIINDFKRINSHICSVAYPILDQAGALQPTRLREEFANGGVKQKHA